MVTRLHNYRWLFAAVFSLVLPAFLITSPELSAAQSKHVAAHSNAEKLTDIVRDPADVPPPVGNRAASLVRVTLTAEEVLGTLDPTAGTTYRYWTFNGKVPGPMIRVRQGDTVELTLRNAAGDQMVHSIDLHAALGPGGGAALSQVLPGQSKTFTFQATTPGLFVYHCGTPMIAEHMANGMYGLILVEPEGGLPKVDHEYYLMQGEIYTADPKGKDGLQQFSAAKLMHETPEYFVFNGAVDAVSAEHALPAKVGDTVRILFGNAGPNATSSTHMVGEIFTHVYEMGSLTSPPLNGVQTAGVPSGAAAVIEFVARQPGKYALMDHAISRMAKGNMAFFNISGPENAALMHGGAASDQGTASVSGVTAADETSNLATSGVAQAAAGMENRHEPEMQMDGTMQMDHGMMHMRDGAMMHMQDSVKTVPANVRRRFPVQGSKTAAPTQTSLVGCLTIATDGKAILKALQSAKIYRLEAQPLLFSQNANRLVNVNGRFGSVMASEDPSLASFVVASIDEVAPNCSAKLSAAQIQRTLLKRAEADKGIVKMSDMGFLPPTLTVNAGERVVWMNSSEVTHNVIADPAKALYEVDVKLPSGVKPFGSGYLQPGQSFSRTFEVPGTYRYVCTLHESSGMKGIIIVRPSQVLRASK